MKLTFTPSAWAYNDLRELELEVDELLSEFEKCPIGKKDGWALIPATFKACPPTCRNHGMEDRKDCGGNALHRLGSNVVEMNGFGADLDHLTEADLQAVIAGLQKRSLAFFWWNTFSHNPPGDARARILIPFLKPFQLKSHAQWSKGAWPMLVRHFGLDSATRHADNTCRDPARVYYLPRKPNEEVTRACGYVPGEAFDWEPVFGTALDRFADAALIEIRAPQEDPARPVDLKEVREALKVIKQPSLVALVKKLLAGNALVPPPAIRLPGTPSRYEAWRTVTAAFSMVAEEWMSTEALLEVLRPAWQAEVNESPNDYTEWQTVADLFVKARSSAPRRKAEREAQREADQQFWESVLGKQFTPMPEEDDEEETAPVLSGPELIKKLKFIQHRGAEKPSLRKALHNLSVLMCESYLFFGAFRKNLVSQMVEIHSGPLFTGKVRDFKNADIGRLRQWFVENFDVEFSLTDVNAYVDIAADDHAYDPIKDYLEGVTWDGIGRLDMMLETYFGASTTTKDGGDRTAYVRAVSAKWMIAAVARGIRPGCQADNMLVLQGAQGLRKSSALRVLGGAFFVGFSYDLRSNDAKAAATENWICEMAELSSLSRAERDHVKDFLTQTADKYRAPYDRRQESHVRRCIFAGTTNDEEIFSDDTGNRRFWPVQVSGLDGKIDTIALERDRDQLWAEAVARFKAGEKWHFDEEQEAAAAIETDARMQTDTLMEQVSDWFVSRRVEERPAHVRSSDIARDILHENGLLSHAETRRIASVLKRMGFKSTVQREGQIVFRAWRTPSGLMEAPHRPRHVNIVHEIAEAQVVAKA